MPVNFHGFAKSNHRLLSRIVSFVCFFLLFSRDGIRNFKVAFSLFVLPVDLLLIVALLLYYQNNHLSMIPRYINFISNEESCKLLQAHPF